MQLSQNSKPRHIYLSECRIDTNIIYLKNLLQVSLMEMGSEQVAGVLRASGSRVRLVVARSVDPATVHPSPAPIVPHR